MDKAIVVLRDLHHNNSITLSFNTNQEAADFMVSVMGQLVDVDYCPIGCLPMCSSCAHEAA